MSTNPASRSTASDIQQNEADVIQLAGAEPSRHGTGDKRTVIFAASLVAAALALLLTGTLVLSGGQESTLLATDVVTAAPRDLEMRILGRGTVEPSRVVPIKSPIESNRARIVWLLDEGESVAAGELVARFDKRPFKEALELSQQRLREAEAQVVRAEKSLALATEENAGKTEAATRLLEVAEIEVADVSDGSGRVELRRLTAMVEKAQRGLRIAEVEQADYQSLFEQGHISRKELEVAIDGLRNATDSLALARDELAGFQRYEWPRRKREAALKLEAARAELARVQRTTALDRQRLEADLAKSAQESAAARQMVEKNSWELEHTDLRAPIAGTLLHTEVPQDGTRRKVQVGDAVWLGQTFLKIPDTSDLDVQLYVRELDVAKLQPGMKASIELDAFVGQAQGGVVTRVAKMATGDEAQREFLVEVRFNESPDSVHPGMSANVAIVHDLVAAEVSVPARALRHSGGQAMVDVQMADGDLQSRKVTVGANNGVWVQLLAGIDQGEQVAVR